MALANDGLGQLVKVEHYRLHCVEAWPDSSHKQAVLAGIHSALQRLEAALPDPPDPPACMVCASRRREPTVVQFPSGPQRLPAIARRAA